MTHAIPLMFSTSLCNIGKAGERSENERSQRARKGLFSFIVFLECALFSFARPLFWSSQLPRDPETGPFSTCWAVKPSGSRRREGVEVSKRTLLVWSMCWRIVIWKSNSIWSHLRQYISILPFLKLKKLCLASFCFSLSWLIYWTCIIFKKQKTFPVFLSAGSLKFPTI